MSWTAANVPNLAGKTAVVTGANSGIGFEAARVLAAAGARVFLACRSSERGTAAVGRIQTVRPQGEVQLVKLDLASLNSVSKCAEELAERCTRVDILINNAGVMMPPFSQTEDGFELQFGVNFLGHYAFTGKMLSLLEAAPAARVVSLSSLAHRTGTIDYSSFRAPQNYWSWRAYEQSKLACLMFAFELDRVFQKNTASTVSLAAHPGGVRTELQRHNWLFYIGAQCFGMSPASGALPTLYAATEPHAKRGSYIGPKWCFEFIGPPAPAVASKRARDKKAAQTLWQHAEDLTGVRYFA